MKKNKITGWHSVYQFTIAQNIKNKSYIISTVFITLFVAILAVCVNVLPGIIFNSESKKDEHVNGIDVAYICDESGLAAIDYSGITGMEGMPEGLQIQVVDSCDGIVDQITENAKNEDAAKEVLVDITADDSGYSVTLTLPEDSKIDGDASHGLASMISDYFRQKHCEELNITEEQINFKDVPVTSDVILLGKEDNISQVAMFVEYFVNIAIIFVCMLLINSYGKMSASVVAMEKSSKVMELLLTSVRPIATILGKVLAMSTLLLGQLVLWIVTGAVFYIGSNNIMASVDDKYTNGLSELVSTLGKAGITVKLTPLTIILSLFIVVTGFTAYIAIAAFIGAMVGKIEELGQSIQTFSFLAVAGAYLPLFGFINMVNTGLMHNPLLDISRILPISSLYIVPSEMLLGTGQISDGLISAGVNLLTLCLLMAFISKVYESVILYSGNRLKLKDVIKMSKNS